jgi:hypothetical protein
LLASAVGPRCRGDGERDHNGKCGPDQPTHYSILNRCAAGVNADQPTDSPRALDQAQLLG